MKCMSSVAVVVHSVGLVSFQGLPNGENIQHWGNTMSYVITLQLYRRIYFSTNKRSYCKVTKNRSSFHKNILFNFDLN